MKFKVPEADIGWGGKGTQEAAELFGDASALLCPAGTVLHWSGEHLPDGWGYFSHIDNGDVVATFDPNEVQVQLVKGIEDETIRLRSIVKLPENNLNYFKRKYGTRRSE